MTLVSQTVTPYQMFSKAVIYIFVFLIGLAFASAHLDASPSQKQLTHLVWLLPLAFIIHPKVQISTDERRFVLFSALMFVSALISFWLAGDVTSFQSLKSYWGYLLPIGLVVTLANIKVTCQGLYGLLILAAVMAFIVVVKDHLYGGVRGAHHGLAIPYGVMSASTGLLCLIFSFDRSVPRWLRAGLAIAFLLGMTAVVWSLTRGAWLFLLLWGVAFVGLGFLKEISLRRKIAAVFVLAAIFVALALSPAYKAIDKRVAQAYQQIEYYMSGKSANTSTGQRFELWKVAINTFAENPVLGAGRSGFLREKQAMNAEKEVKIRSWLEHAHNDVLWILATRGILGLAAFVAFFAFLFNFYRRSLSNPDTRLAAYAGLTVRAGALVYGLTDIFMSLKLTVGYFMILNALLIRHIISQRNAAAPYADD